MMVSAPSRPLSELLAELPERVLAREFPFALLATVSVRVSFSTKLAAVNVVPAVVEAA